MERPVLLYDGGCRFCRASARYIQRADRKDRFAFLAFDAPEAAFLVGAITQEELSASFHLIGTDGDRLSAGKAAIEVMKGLTFPWSWLGAFLEAFRLEPLVQRIYELVSANRPKLSPRVKDAPGPHVFP